MKKGFSPFNVIGQMNSNLGSGAEPMGNIVIAGTGIEGIEAFSPKILERMQKAEVLIGGQSQLDLFPDFVGEKVVVGDNPEAITGRLLTSEKPTVIIVSGDPLFFGIGRSLLRNLPADRLEFIPNVSSVQHAFARIKIPWDDAVFISVIDRDLRLEMDRVVTSDKMAILTDQKNTPALIAQELIARGRDVYTVYLCENLGMENERIARTSLKKLQDMTTQSLSILILVREFEGPEQESIPLLGIPDGEFHVPKNVLTQEEIRVLTLGKLRLQHGTTLWDIGAGSGSVSIEADNVLKTGRIFAIEKEAERLDVLKRNLRRFNSRKIIVVPEEAPECLDNLPDPDRVFIGGAGGRLMDVLETVDQRLQPQGRVVINALALDTIIGTSEFFERSGYQVELTAVNIARTDPKTDYKVFESLNLVYIISAEKGLE